MMFSDIVQQIINISPDIVTWSLDASDDLLN